jgi:hypothetical protein
METARTSGYEIALVSELNESPGEAQSVSDSMKAINAFFSDALSIK